MAQRAGVAAAGAESAGQAGKFNLDGQLVSRDFGVRPALSCSGGRVVAGRRPLALAVLFDVPSLTWLGPMLGATVVGGWNDERPGRC